MKTVLIFLMFGFGTAFGQTKLIFYKSHSGSPENDLFADSDPSNFGMAPVREVRTAVLDSVIFLSDKQAVMVTKEYCGFTDYRETAPVDPHMTGSLWKAGRDTIYMHSLFSRQHALDSIKEVLRREYYFRNDIDSTKFIGYDNQKPAVQKNAVAPTPKGPGNRDRNELYLLLTFIGAFLVFGFLYSKPFARSGVV